MVVQGRAGPNLALTCDMRPKWADLPGARHRDRGANEERSINSEAMKHPTDAGQQTFPARQSMQSDSVPILRRTNEQIPNPLVNRGLRCYLQLMNLKASRKIIPLAEE